MKIAFCPLHLSERGTSISTYNYAHYNEKILNNKSIILYQKNNPLTAKCMEDMFLKRFECFTFDNFNEIDEIIEREKIHAIYWQKFGNNDGLLSNKCFNLVHSVFTSEPHGNIYAYLSKFMNIKFDNSIQYVPYMIDLPKSNDNLRNELGILEEAIVFGCYGGNESFNIKFVHECINEIIDIYPNIYFVFMNFKKNTKNHSRIIYLPQTSDLEFKVKFINSCNAMIHARDEGETFGLSCGEFSVCGKPIITYLNSLDKEHIRILGKNGFYYTNKESLKYIFEMFAERKIPDKNIDYNCYREFTPEKVMKIFGEVFLDSIEKYKNSKQ